MCVLHVLRAYSVGVDTLMNDSDLTLLHVFIASERFIGGEFIVSTCIVIGCVHYRFITLFGVHDVSMEKQRIIDCEELFL